MWKDILIQLFIIAYSLYLGWDIRCMYERHQKHLQHKKETNEYLANGGDPPTEDDGNE